MNHKLAATTVIAPGQWLGMLGGGQLGRMFCHAAQAMGYKVAVLDPDENSPAGAVANRHIRAAYDDVQALTQLASLCQAVTTEFENVPALSLSTLASQTRVCPSAQAVAIVQDRIQEKAFIKGAGVPVAPYAVVSSQDQLATLPDDLFPGILKVARLGYDGKGQARVQSRDQAMQAWVDLGSLPCVLEAMLPLASEISVLIARGLDGQVAVYPPASNEHRDGILAVSTVAPGLHAVDLEQQAAQAALALAAALDYVGVMCVEFFVLSDGRLIANEIAPRPHNSGHYTMNASICSQFEQQARVMAGLPTGATDSLCPVIMLNLLGDIWYDSATKAMREPDWAAVLAVPGVSLHLYDKSGARPGRKMGHINVVGTTLDAAHAATAQVARLLGISFP
ncbi:MAG: 5-(carboxyamino)imidazole ribonucleotide synthase [Burkholderiaceae bacterium]|nr:5-(carboxyamino)imidazole ribonucleotide synthase [Burkholderiaceae bacterium]